MYLNIKSNKTNRLWFTKEIRNRWGGNLLGNHFITALWIVSFYVFSKTVKTDHSMARWTFHFPAIISNLWSWTFIFVHSVSSMKWTLNSENTGQTHPHTQDYWKQRILLHRKNKRRQGAAEESRQSQERMQEKRAQDVVQEI